MSPQAGWILQEEIVPRIAGAVPHSILCVGAEDRQELVCDGITMSDSRMQSYRRKIAAKALEFMGAEVLADIVREPGWRISLDCERDAQACRNERRAVATVN